MEIKPFDTLTKRYWRQNRNSRPTPLVAVADIKGYVAFYAEKTDAIEEIPPAT